MTVRIYVPRDAAAIALGAHEVAAAVANEIVSRDVFKSLVNRKRDPSSRNQTLGLEAEVIGFRMVRSHLDEDLVDRDAGGPTNC